MRKLAVENTVREYVLVDVKPAIDAQEGISTSITVQSLAGFKGCGSFALQICRMVGGKTEELSRHAAIKSRSKNGIGKDRYEQTLNALKRTSSQIF